MQSGFNAALLAMGLVVAPTAILSSGGLNSPPTLKTIEVHPLHQAGAIAGAPVDARDGETAPFDFTAAIDWPPAPPGLPGPRPGAGIPIQSDAPVPPSLGARFPPGLASRLPPPPPSPRRGCEEGIDRLMGAAGYLESKIRLQASKRTCGSGSSSPRRRRSRNCASSARPWPHSPRSRPILWSASILRKRRLRSASNSSARSMIPYMPSTNPSPRISARCSPSRLGLCFRCLPRRNPGRFPEIQWQLPPPLAQAAVAPPAPQLLRALQRRGQSARLAVKPISMRGTGGLPFPASMRVAWKQNYTYRKFFSKAEAVSSGPQWGV